MKTTKFVSFSHESRLWNKLKDEKIKKIAHFFKPTFKDQLKYFKMKLSFAILFNLSKSYVNIKVIEPLYKRCGVTTHFPKTKK